MKWIRRFYLRIWNLKNLYPFNPYKITSTLLESQFWDHEKMEKYQLNLFHKLIRSAKKTRFYGNRYFISNSILSLEDVKNLTVTSKDDIQFNSEDFIVNNGEKGFVHASSGSTGKPSKVSISKRAEAYRRASGMRFKSWWGLKPEDKLVNFTAYPRDSNSLIKKIKNYLNPKMDIDIFSINQENIVSIFNKISSYKPKYFRGYVSSIKEFGILLKENKLDIKKINLKVIIVTSEILYDSDRSILEEIFGCRIANEYGCAELGFLAYECPDRGMHLQEEMVLTFVNESDEIISTELNNDLSPLINYKIGDKITFSNKNCICGRSLKLVDRVEGRIGSDDIMRPNGSKMNYLFFDKMIKNLSDTSLWGKVKRFQIIQEGLDFYVYIVKGQNYSEKITQYIVDYIKNGISKDINVDIVFTNHIEPEASGKYRIFKRRK